jgi:hypothetical protein
LGADGEGLAGEIGLAEPDPILLFRLRLLWILVDPMLPI